MSRLRTAYDPCTKFESGAYRKYPKGPNSSLNTVAHADADE